MTQQHSILRVHSLVSRWREECMRALLLLCALLSVVTTLGIVWVLVQESIAFFSNVSPIAFLFGTQWTPLFEPHAYGVLPLICGSTLVTVGAACVALPLGLCIAIFLSEYATARVRGILKPLLEILAGIPTVVYGYFALTTVTPLLTIIFPQTQVFNAASASIVIGIMILPLMASLCDDALRAVPQRLRHAGYALGATPFEVSTRIVVPGAFSGVLAAAVLAIARAVGETMVVALAAGATPKLTLNPFESIQTITAYIVQVSLGDVPAGSIAYQSIFAVGLLLFCMTLVLNVAAHRVLRAYREVYE